MGDPLLRIFGITLRVLEVCREKGLIYLDSRTSSHSTIPRLAKEIGVPLIENHLFLDNVYSERHVLKQMSLLKEHVRKHNRCIAIGHVGPPGDITASVLQRRIPAMQQEVQFVPVSRFVSILEQEQILLNR